MQCLPQNKHKIHTSLRNVSYHQPRKSVLLAKKQKQKKKRMLDGLMNGLMNSLMNGLIKMAGKASERESRISARQEGTRFFLKAAGFIYLFFVCLRCAFAQILALKLA